jgi:hypothetical protein
MSVASITSVKRWVAKRQIWFRISGGRFGNRWKISVSGMLWFRCSCLCLKRWKLDRRGKQLIFQIREVSALMLCLMLGSSRLVDSGKLWQGIPESSNVFGHHLWFKDPPATSIERLSCSLTGPSSIKSRELQPSSFQAIGRFQQFICPPPLLFVPLAFIHYVYCPEAPCFHHLGKIGVHHVMTWLSTFLELSFAWSTMQRAKLAQTSFQLTASKYQNIRAACKDQWPSFSVSFMLKLATHTRNEE